MASVWSNIVRVQSPYLPQPSFSPPLEVGLLIQLGAWGSAVNFPSGVGLSEAWAANDFCAFWGWRNAVGGIIGARFQKKTENGFSLHFYEEIFQELFLSFCSHIIVKVQAI